MPAPPSPGESGIYADIAQPPHPGRLRRFGQGALAATATLLLLPAAVSANFHADRHHGPAAGPETPAPRVSGGVEGYASVGEASKLPMIVLPPRTTPFEFGVTVYNAQFEDAPDLFSDEQKLDMNGDRETLIRSRWRSDLAVVKKDSQEASAKGIDVAVDLADATGVSRAGFPAWAAHMAAQLPYVHRVIIENEVNNPSANPADGFYGFSMQDYVDELHATYLAIKAVRPDMEVDGFGLDSIDAHDPVGYLQRAALYASIQYGGLADIEDGLSVHSYGDLEKAQYLMDAYSTITTQPIYVDEFGRNAADGLSYREQARQMVQFVLWAYSQPQIAAVNTYHMQNGGDQWLTGLKSPDGRWLPSGHAYQKLPPLTSPAGPVPSPGPVG